MKSDSPSPGHLVTPPGLAFIPPGHRKHDEASKVGRGHRRDETGDSTVPGHRPGDRVELSAAAVGRTGENVADSADAVELSSGGFGAGGVIDLAVTQSEPGKLHLGLTVRSPTDGVAFSVTGDLDLSAGAGSIRVDVQTLGQCDQQLAGLCDKRSFSFSVNLASLEFRFRSREGGVEASRRRSPHELAFHLVQLVTKLARRKGDQVISLDLSDPEMRDILNLDGGRFGRLLLGFLEMLARQHSGSDADGPEHFRISIRGRQHLRRFFLSFQELTVRRMSISFTFTFTPPARAASSPLPGPDRKDTLRGEGPHGPDGHPGNHPQPPHARGRALRATA
jgi:hypothetical protein